MIHRRRVSSFCAACVAALAAAATGPAPAAAGGGTVSGVVPAAPIELVEEAGDGDGFLDPGERWSFRPTVVNLSGNVPVTLVSAALGIGSGSAPIVLHDSSVSFGVIPAGATRAANERVRFTLAEGAPCSGAALIDLLDLVASTGIHHDGGQAFYREVGEVAATDLVSQDFAGGIAPFHVVDGGTGVGPAATWTAANPGNHQILDPPFAIVDADQHAQGGETMDEALETSAAQMGLGSSVPEIRIEFDHVFSHWVDPPDEIADVEFKSLATFGQWVRIARFTGRDEAGHVSIDLSSYHPELYVVARFRYYDAGWEYYWAIDNVKIRAIHARSCSGSSVFFSDGFESGDTAAWALTEP